MRIVALDDDLVVLDMLSKTLEAEGHACTTHTTGASLMKDMRRETYDLLILDWQLPDTSGPVVTNGSPPPSKRAVTWLAVSSVL